jgi:hypothetical protein
MEFAMRGLSVLCVVAVAALSPTHALGAGPTCALLDPEKTPQAALLEAKLLADPSATWVERAGIDKVLKEQKLQALFSPTGVGERVQLGKLLKADVLVMVRPVKDVPEPALEVVVSETAGGLRLLVRAVPVTKDVAADVATLLAAVKDGLRKHGEKVTDVVAVPPFVSRNLESNYDHLKLAFAKLAEAEALDRKGVVVVELEEAEAMAKELALAAPGAKLDRPAPVYLLGEYRFEGKGKDQTVAIKLRAERAGKAVGDPKTLTGKPSEAPKVLREWSAGLLDTLAKDDKPRPPADPKAEAGQLAARAEDFRRLGDWAEAAGLIEAALLLDPGKTDLHADILAVLLKVTERHWSYGGQELDPAKIAIRAHLRGLEHLEAFVDQGGDLGRYEHPIGLTMYFLHLLKPLGLGQKALPEVRALLEEAQQAQREVLLRIIPVVAKQGKGAELTLIHGAVMYLPQKEKYALLEQLLRQLNHLPDPVERAVRYSQFTSSLYNQNTPEFRAFLDRLASDKDVNLRAAGERLKKKLQHDTTDPIGPKDKPPTGSSAKFVSLRPIPLAFDPADGKDLNEKLYDIVAAGPGVDVLSAGGAVFVMKQKGKPKKIWGPGKNLFALSLTYDGKYVWVASARNPGDAVLLVVDPKAEKVWEVTGDHGMPRRKLDETKRGTDAHLRAAPLAPGRVCVAGHFDRRGWIGVATFDPSGGPAVKVTQESRALSDAIKDDIGHGLEVAFVPTYLLAVAGQPDANKQPTTRVLLGRTGFEGHTFHTRPLALDPDRPATQPRMIERMDAGLKPEAVDAFTDGALYYSFRTNFGGKDARRIERVPFPGGKKEETAAYVSHGETCLRFQEGKLNIVVSRQWGEQAKIGGPAKITTRWEWWQYDPATKKAVLLGDDVPPVQYLAVSAHYGPVAISGVVRGGKASLHSVAIENPGAGYDYNPITNTPKKSAGDMKLIWTADTAKQPILQYHFVPEADLIVCGSGVGAFNSLGAIDAKTGQVKAGLFADPPKPVMDFYPLAGTRFGTRSRDETRVRLWDAKTGKADGEIAFPELPDVKPPEGNYMHVQLSPDGKFLAVARAGASHKPVPCPFRLINLSTGKAVMSFDWTGGSVHFTADSSRVLLAEYGGMFRWFKVPTGEADGGWEFTEPDGTGIYHRVHGVSADGGVIAYSGPRNTRRDFSLAMLNGKTGEVLRRFRPEYLPRPGILSGDGRFVVLHRPPAQGRLTFEVFPTAADSPAVAQVAVPYDRSIPLARLSPDGRIILVHDHAVGKLNAYEVPITQPTVPSK